MSSVQIGSKIILSFLTRNISLKLSGQTLHWELKPKEEGIKKKADAIDWYHCKENTFSSLNVNVILRTMLFFSLSENKP